MQVASKSSNPGVRVVLHISPSVYVAGILSAQRRGQKLNEFLDSAITKASSSDPDDPAHDLPWSPHAAALFLQVADTTPEALRGPWKVLYAKVVDDPTLWEAPQATVGDFEASLATDGWRINEAALVRAWPRMVSSVFAC